MGGHRLWTMELESRQDTGFMHLGYARLCNGLVPYRPGREGVQHIHQLKREHVSKFHAYHVNYMNLDGVRA